MKLDLKPDTTPIEITLYPSVTARREKTGTVSFPRETRTGTTLPTESWIVWEKNPKNSICSFILYYEGEWTLAMNEDLMDESVFELGRTLARKRNDLKPSSTETTLNLSLDQIQKNW